MPRSLCTKNVLVSHLLCSIYPKCPHLKASHLEIIENICVQVSIPHKEKWVDIALHCTTTNFQVNALVCLCSRFFIRIYHPLSNTQILQWLWLFIQNTVEYLLVPCCFLAENHDLDFGYIFKDYSKSFEFFEWLAYPRIFFYLFGWPCRLLFVLWLVYHRLPLSKKIIS